MKTVEKSYTEYRLVDQDGKDLLNKGYARPSAIKSALKTRRFGFWEFEDVEELFIIAVHVEHTFLDFVEEVEVSSE